MGLTRSGYSFSLSSYIFQASYYYSICFYFLSTSASVNLAGTAITSPTYGDRIKASFSLLAFNKVLSMDYTDPTADVAVTDIAEILPLFYGLLIK